MTAWTIEYSKEAAKDLALFDGNTRPQIEKVIRRVSLNPLPQSEGGYGKELGNHNGNDLSGCLKIKLKKAGIRIVYLLERTNKGMKIIIIGIRDKDSVYKEAARRLGR